MRIASSPRFASKTLAAAAATVLLGAAADARAAEAYYERSFVLAAHEKCGLFEPRLIAALDAATLQARGAALRAGRAAGDLAAMAERAQGRAAALPCDHADLKRVRSRVQAGFAGWSRAARMTFPGGHADWRADRYSGRETGWRLMQQAAVGGSPVRFGLSGLTPQATSPTAVVSFAGRPRPYAARIVMRDVSRLPRPWLTHADPPPESVRKAVFAAGFAPAPKSLMGPEDRQGEVWTFSQAAADALAELDPRETFTIEFLFRDNSVATARFEAGDFAAARAFLGMGAI